MVNGKRTNEIRGVLNEYSTVSTACCYWFILQVPCIVMVEEVDNQNLYMAVSSPNLNFNITRDVPFGSRINGDERFYSISMPVEVQVI